MTLLARSHHRPRQIATLLTAFVTALATSLLAQSPPAVDSLRWYNYPDGVKQSKATGKPQMLFFWHEGCTYCEKMLVRVFTDTSVVRRLHADFVSIKIDVFSKDSLLVDGAKLPEETLAKVKFGVRPTPTIWFTDSAGCRVRKLKGYMPTPYLLAAMKEVKETLRSGCPDLPLTDRGLPPVLDSTRTTVPDSTRK